MKKCLNCGTPNEDNALHCGTCRMPGKFRPMSHEADLPKADGQAGPLAQARCPNCGALLTNMVGKCPNCKFPLPGQQGMLPGLEEAIKKMGNQAPANKMTLHPYRQAFQN